MRRPWHTLHRDCDDLYYADCGKHVYIAYNSMNVISGERVEATRGTYIYFDDRRPRISGRCYCRKDGYRTHPYIQLFSLKEWSEWGVFSPLMFA